MITVAAATSIGSNTPGVTYRTATLGAMAQQTLGAIGGLTGRQGGRSAGRFPEAEGYCRGGTCDRCAAG
jgi:hypothetical protein